MFAFLLIIHPAMANTQKDKPDSVRETITAPASDPARADAIPEQPGVFSYGYDFTSQTLSTEQLSEINKEGQSLAEKTGVQAIVLVVNTFGQYTGNEFVTNTINRWGIGSQNKNDGILIALAVGDGLIQIGTGSGIDTVLTDQKAGAILDEHLHYFAAGQYGKGLLSIYRDISAFLVPALTSDSVLDRSDIKHVLSYANFTLRSPDGWTFEDPKEDGYSRFLTNGEKGWYLRSLTYMPLESFCQRYGIEHSANPQKIIESLRTEYTGENNRDGSNANQAWYILYREKSVTVFLAAQTSVLQLTFSCQTSSSEAHTPSYTESIAMLNELCAKATQDSKPAYYSLWGAFPFDDYESACQAIQRNTGSGAPVEITENSCRYEGVRLWDEQYDLFISKRENLPVLSEIRASRDLDGSNPLKAVDDILLRLENKFGTFDGSVLYGSHGMENDAYSLSLNESGNIDLDRVHEFIHEYASSFWKMNIMWRNITLHISGSKGSDITLSIQEDNQFNSSYPLPAYGSGELYESTVTYPNGNVYTGEMQNGKNTDREKWFMLTSPSTAAAFMKANGSTIIESGTAC